MKKNILVYLASGFLVLSVGAALWAQHPESDSSPKAPQAWQHLALEREGKSVTQDTELAQRINSLGEQGWQLVDVESIGEAGTTSKMVFFFKRPR